MLKGVLSGSPASAPVFVLDPLTDLVKPEYIGHRYNVGSEIAGTTRVRVMRVEITAWRGRVMGFFYRHPEEEERFSSEGRSSSVSGGSIMRRNEEWGAGGEDLEILSEALAQKEAKLFFAFRLFSKGSAFYSSYAEVRLTKSAQQELQVWLDQVLEQQS